MISTAGLPINLALRVLERERETFETAIERNTLNAREISAFRERIGSITTVDQLVDDYEVYSFVMKAYDLEDQMFGKAMMKKVLSSDPLDKTSLINRLTDSRFKELFNGLGFSENGKANENTKNPEWVEGLVDRYVEQKLINDQLSNNESVGIVLHTARKAPTLTTWYSVLADTKLQNFFYTALGFPDAMKGTDVDAQVNQLKKKFDLDSLKEPGVLEDLTKRYVAIASANNASAVQSSNPVLQLLGNSGQQRSIVSINLSGLTALSASRYMR